MKNESLPDLLSYRELAAHDLTRHGLAQLIESDQFEKVAPGLFLRTGTADDTTAAWIAIAQKRPEATLCLLTALSIHDLSDEIPRQSDIAIPRGMQTVSVSGAPISWHRFDPDTFDIGREHFPLPAGRTIGIYSSARTVVDVFRLRHTWGNDLAHGALKRWLAIPGNSPSALLNLAEHFPKARPALHHALEVLL